MHPAIWPSLCNHFFFPRQGSTAGSVLSVPGGICRTTTTPHVSHLSFLSLVVAAVTVATVAAARWCLGSWRCPARARRVSSLGTATHVANHGESHWNSWNILQYCSECWLLEISPSKNQPPSIICWWWYKSNHKLPQRQTQVDTPFVTQIALLNLIDASILDILTNPTFFCPHQVVEPENLTLDLHKDGKIMQNPSSSVIVRFPNLGQNPTPVSILSIMINVNTMDSIQHYDRYRRYSITFPNVLHGQTSVQTAAGRYPCDPSISSIMGSGPWPTNITLVHWFKSFKQLEKMKHPSFLWRCWIGTYGKINEHHLLFLYTSIHWVVRRQSQHHSQASTALSRRCVTGAPRELRGWDSHPCSHQPTGVLNTAYPPGHLHSFGKSPLWIR